MYADNFLVLLLYPMLSACFKILYNSKGPITIFQAFIFLEIFDKRFSCVILLKLSKFRYQTVFTSQIMQ